MTPGGSQSDKPSTRPGWPVASSRAGRHAWEQMWVWWMVMFAAAAVVVALALATVSGIPGWQRAAGLVLLAVLAGAYLWIGLPAMKCDDERRGFIYIALAIAIEAVLLCIHPASFTLLFGIYPQCYAAFTRIRRGAVAGLVLTIVAGVASFGWSGWKRAEIPGVLIQISFSAGFGLLFGAFITSIIRQSGERADLIVELEQTRSELTSAHRAAGVQAERERLAAEIHDTLAQGFTSIVLLAQAAQSRLAVARVDLGGDASSPTSKPNPATSELAAIEATARDNLAESRALVAALQPVALHESSLPDAIGRLVDRLNSDTGVVAVLTVSGAVRMLDTDAEVALLRGSQEALANVRRHARATAVDVHLGYGSVMTLEVGDDGRGFDPSRDADGFGLIGLRRRVEQLGGIFSLTSAPGHGTRIRIELACPDLVLGHFSSQDPVPKPGVAVTAPTGRGRA